MSEKYTVYVIFSKTIDRYYTGYTNDLDRRLSEHNRKKGKYTDAGIPWEVVYTEQFELKHEAQEREKYIKSRKSRIYIEDLIKNNIR